MSSEQMRNSEFRDAFEKKLVKLGVFGSFQNVLFSRYLPFFPKKAKIWTFWEFLSSKNTFGTHSRWN